MFALLNYMQLIHSYAILTFYINMTNFLLCKIILKELGRLGMGSFWTVTEGFWLASMEAGRRKRCAAAKGNGTPFHSRGL